MAINQKQVLDALVGNRQILARPALPFFICDTPLATNVGGETLLKGGDMAAAKKALAESGYDGTPVVIMAPGDVTTLQGAAARRVAQQLRDAGFKVDLQATDWQTVVTRRASQKAPKDGGWNMFFTNWVSGRRLRSDCQSHRSAASGKNGGWFGWADDPKIEQLTRRFRRVQASARRSEEDRHRYPEPRPTIR